MSSAKETFNPWLAAWRRFRSDKLAMLALVMLAVLLMIALLAPLLANPRPLLEYIPGSGLSVPFLRTFFAPESTEYCIEQIFNYESFHISPLSYKSLYINKQLIKFQSVFTYNTFIFFKHH